MLSGFCFSILFFFISDKDEETRPSSYKEVIYLRNVPESVSMVQPEFSESFEESRLSEKFNLENDKYQMFLKWLEAQKYVDEVEKSEHTPEIELKNPETIIEEPEFHDVIDEDDEPSTISEPTVKLNPEYLQNLVQQAEKLAESLPKVEVFSEEKILDNNQPFGEEISLEEVQALEPLLEDLPTNPEPVIPKEVRVGQTLIQLESSSPDHSDEEVVIQSKLTISGSHLELQTLKTGASGSQSSLNLSVPPPQEKTQTLHGSQSSLRPVLHSKGKAPLAPPKAMPENKKSPKKSKIFASLSGIFKSEGHSSKDAVSGNAAPKETQI